VDDVVTAFCDAGRSVWTGVANVGGGSRVSMNKVVEIVGVLVGGVHVARGGVQLGDVRHTAADITVAREGFGYRPMTRVAEGLERMVAAERAAMSPKEVGAVPTADAPMTEL
jgi:nucleoside-diphosphate-sugar epimerase